MKLRVVLILLLATSGAAGATQTPAQVPATGTGLIVGQVVDAITGQPVPEAIVSMGLYAQLPTLTTPHGRVMADDEGRFFFGDLPAGSYSLGASKDGFYQGSFGTTRAGESGARFALANGQVRTDATIRLWKLSTITGTVLDEVGEPVIGVTVHALSRRLRGGRQLFWDYSNDLIVTDDRGVFRISSLPPGDYIVGMISSSATFPPALLGTGGLNPNYRFTAAMASAELAPLGNARVQQFGDFALLTQSKILVPPPTKPGAPLEVYRSTFYPSTSAPNEAAIISVAGGDERTGIDIRLKPVTAVRVSGKIVGADGAVGPVAVRLEPAPIELNVGGARTPVTALSDTSGAFTILGVTSGRYTMRVETVSSPTPDMLWASMPLTVGATDVTNLVVQLKPVISVSGRVEFRSASGRAPGTSQIGRIILERAAGDYGYDATIRPPGQTFSQLVPGGPYTFGAMVQQPWYVQSVMVAGRDVSLSPIDLQGDISTAVIVVTDSPSRLTGVVRDARGAAVKADVVVFPTDSSRWTTFGWNPRHIVNAASAAATGAYSFVNIPAGEYFIAALSDLTRDSEGGWAWQKSFEAIAPKAQRITIADGEQKAVDLVVRSIR